ncbi:uncharacterized protein LOC124168083 [Ischnura elegans]|uniref:uncharacterized protein LOC124168083 n=1 Tax=Ischnura elegans TaxID=197161 RepID=UPI001ED88468|nr:uncharacterized protein LOC124168083 [Ischnura elegans]
MGTSVMLLAFASFLLICGGVSSSGCRWEPIRLSFAAVRGGQQQSASPQLFPDSPCGGENTRLTCSEGRHPDDFTCNTGLMSEDPNWEGWSRIVGIELKYDHEMVENSSCTLNFNAEGGTNFGFAGGKCTTDIRDKTVPPFRMSKITSLRVAVNPVNTIFSGPEWCFTKNFIFAREGVQEEQNDQLGIPPPPVRFILNSYECINTLPKPYPNFVGGRIRTVTTTYTHDGRRNRPKKSD